MADSSYDENKEGRVLKTDVLGRVKTGVPQREAILDEFERSGLSGTKFAAVAGVNYQTFASWVQKRRKATGAYRSRPRKTGVNKGGTCPAATPPALRWVEAVVDGQAQCASGGSTVLRLELPCGASMKIADEAQAVLAAQLLKAWQNPPVR